MPFPENWTNHPDGSVGPPGTRMPRNSKPPKANQAYEDFEMFSGVDLEPEDPSFKSLPTEYNGRTYRSRAEARWALTFDILGLKHQYEPQMIDTPLGRYLPDFYLPTQCCWIEVKGPHPTPEEKAKARALALQSHKPVYIFACGIPVIGADGAPRYECKTEAGSHGWRFDSLGTEATGFMFGVKECCGKLGVVFDALTGLMDCSCLPSKYDPGYLYTFQLAFQRGRLRRW